MLSSLRIFFYRALEFFRWIFGIVPKSSIGGSKVVFRIVHYTFWVLLIVLCAIFSPWVRDPDAIRNAGRGDFVANYWLGILVFLFYVLGKAVVYVLSLLRIEDRPEFEDIERCWRAGMEAFERERMDFQWIPVFLVNGLTAQQEKAMFKAADLSWRVIAPPLEDTAAVLRFYANDEQVFISCTGIGAMNRQVSKPVDLGPTQTTSMAGGGSGRGGGAAMGTLMSPGVGGGAPPAAGNSPLGTQMAPGGGPPAGGPVGGGTMVAPPGGMTAPAPPAPTPEGGSGGGGGGQGILGTIRSMGTFVAQRTMMPGAMGRVAAGFGGAAGGSSRQPAGINPIDPEEIEFAGKRLEYVCDLLMQERDPYCPINGMIQSSPLAWSEHDRAASELSPISVHDLRKVHDCLGLQFPVAFLFTGLDQVAGLPGFIRRCGELDPRFSASRAGSRFPAGAEISEDNCNWVIDRGLGWFRGWIYAVFARDLKQGDNKRLYHLLCNLQQRRDRLSTQLRLSLSGVCRNPNLRLAGCYFAATGEATNYQGFIKGLLLRLVTTQGEVAWHPEHIARDKRSRSLGYVLMICAALLLVGNVIGLYWAYKHRQSGEDATAVARPTSVLIANSDSGPLMDLDSPEGM